MKRKIFIALALLALGAGLAASWIAGGILIAPHQRTVGAPPSDLRAEAVDWTSPDGRRVHGWFAKGKSGQGAIILLHALRADRRVTEERAWNERLTRQAHAAFEVLCVGRFDVVRRAHFRNHHRAAVGLVVRGGGVVRLW